MKRIRYAVLKMRSGDSKMVVVKTTTDRYMRKLISDMGLSLSVKDWEFVG